MLQSLQVKHRVLNDFAKSILQILRSGGTIELTKYESWVIESNM